MRTITHAIDTRPFFLISVLFLEKKRPGNEATKGPALATAEKNNYPNINPEGWPALATAKKNNYHINCKPGRVAQMSSPTYSKNNGPFSSRQDS